MFNNKKQDVISLDKDFVNICNSLNKIFNDDVISETNYSIFNATRNILHQNLEGSFVECGVYQGKKIAFIIEVLKLFNINNRDIYLVDTFTGNTEPSEFDTHIDGKEAKENIYYSSLEEVKKNILSLNYPSEKIHFIKMDVRETSKLSNKIKSKVSILRIDTDYYHSVYSILNALYDKVIDKGYIIHDDYGSWMGHYKAVNDFFKNKSLKPVFFKTSRKEIVQIKI